MVRVVDDPGCPTVGTKGFGRGRGSSSVDRNPAPPAEWEHRRNISVHDTNVPRCLAYLAKYLICVWNPFELVSSPVCLSCRFPLEGIGQPWPIGGIGRSCARLLAIAANNPLRNARFLFLSANEEEITSNSGTPTTCSDPQAFSAVQGSDNESGPQV